MGMMQRVPIPGTRNGEEAEARAEMLQIAGDPRLTYSMYTLGLHGKDAGQRFNAEGPARGPGHELRKYWYTQELWFPSEFRGGG